MGWVVDAEKLAREMPLKNEAGLTRPFPTMMWTFCLRRLTFIEEGIPVQPTTVAQLWIEALAIILGLGIYVASLTVGYHGLVLRWHLPDPTHDSAYHQHWLILGLGVPAGILLLWVLLTWGAPLLLH